MSVTIHGIQGLRAIAGTDLPPTAWLDVGQDLVDGFAELTGDAQWIHVDPARAQAGPFGTTVAHGFLTLALVPRFWHQCARIEGFRLNVNYGLNRVRFPAPLTIPSRVRGRLRVEEVEDLGAAAQSLLHATIEREGGEKPVCVAELLIRHYR